MQPEGLALLVLSCCWVGVSAGRPTASYFAMQEVVRTDTRILHETGELCRGEDR